MRRYSFLARCRVSVVAFAVVSIFTAPAFADTSEGTSSSGGSASGSATTAKSSNSTWARGTVRFNSDSNAKMSTPDSGSASAASQATGAANAASGRHVSAIHENVATNSSATESGVSKGAHAYASASGRAGRATISVNAQAQAQSVAGQLTASASASDGSTAIAALGTITNLQTFVPGGVTKLLQNGGISESISCNSGGTCSYATLGNNSVSAGIKLFASTGTVTFGAAEAYLSSVLSVYASAGSMGVSATASSNITGAGSSGGKNYSTAVVAQLWASSGSRVWTAQTASGTVIGTVWRSGGAMCVSTQVQYKHSRRTPRKIVECKTIAPHIIARHQQSGSQFFLTNLFKSRPPSIK